VSVTFSKNVATLTSVVTVDDAEPFTEWLRTTAHPRVRMAGCTHLHASVLQALLAARPKIASLPTTAFLSLWVAPLLIMHHPPVPSDKEPS
jgi:hypothetical protein